MFKDFFDGVSSYGKAWNIISTHKLWYYVLMPGLISLILGGSIAYSAYLIHDDFSFYLQELYPSSWWGYAIFERIAWFFGGVILAVLGILSYRNILMALLSPFMSPLSAKVQEIQTGVPVYDPPFFSFTNLRLILRGLYFAFRNLFKELWFTAWLLLLGLIPFLGLMVPFILFFVQSFYSGFGNLDYTLEKFYDVKGSKQFSQRHRWLAVGNGTVFLLLLGVPVLGLFFAPALSTVAATLEAVKRVDAPLKSQKQLEEYI
jgi:CysZ protein